jgi:hypothetical protein
MKRSVARKVIAVALAAVLLIAVGTASAVRLQFGDFVLVADGKFTPTALPKRHDSPISLQGKARISTASGKLPPILDKAVIEYDRHGSVQTAGLAICPGAKLEATNVATARSRCPEAIVGEGVAHAIVKLPDQERIPISSPITLFNGPRTNGFPTVFAHAYTTVPAPTALVVPVVIETIHLGAFGYRTKIDIPTIAGGAGVLISGSLKIGKRWTYKGKRHSFVNARCEVGHLQVRGEFSFTDGTYVKGVLVKSCGVRD